MTLEQIKQAVSSGKIVHHQNKSYTVTVDKNNQWLIRHTNGYCIGLTWLDGVTLNGEESEFYIEE